MAKLDDTFPLYEDEDFLIYIEHKQGYTRLVVRIIEFNREFILDRGDFKEAYLLYSTVGGRQLGETVLTSVRTYGAVQGL